MPPRAQVIRRAREKLTKFAGLGELAQRLLLSSSLPELDTLDKLEELRAFLQGQLELAQRLLLDEKVKALHAAAAQLAASAQLLREAGPPPLVLKPGRLHASSVFLAPLLILAGVAKFAEGAHGAALRGPLVAALASSHVLDHAALFLDTAQCTCGPFLTEGELAKMYQEYARAYGLFLDLLIKVDTRTKEQLRRALASHWASHMVCALGWSALRGGLDAGIGQLATAHNKQSRVLSLRTLASRLHPDLLPPTWGPFATVKVLLRAWTAAAARGPGCLLGSESEEDAMRVAAVVMCSLVDGILSRRPWPGCWAELAADVWRQVAACMPVECRSIAWEAVAVPVAGLAQMLDVDADASGSHCGGGGPPGMAAALAGGALPFLERLLRRSGSMLPRTPQEAGQAARAERLLRALIREGKHLGLERTVMSLLAYGDGLQAAAFMASVTKQRQRTAALLSLGSPGYIGFWLATGVLAAAIDAKVFDGAAVLAQRTERTETWALVLSIAVGEWLPALSSLLWLRLLESARACVATQQAWGTSFRIVMVTSMCAGFLSPSRSGDGWRRDAIRQAGLVPLVGAAMQVFPGPSCGMEESSVADWAVQLACAAPDEVLRAHGDLAWRPEAVRALAQESESSGARLEPVVLCRLAQHLEAGLPEFKGRVLAQPPDPRLPNLLPALSPLLVPPAEARRRLGLPPACANPACVNLAGDSEIALQRQKCGGCGRVEYCSRECQREHWKAGHEAACSTR